MLGKGHTIRGLEKCDFTPIYEHYMAKKEADKARSKEVGAATSVRFVVLVFSHDRTG